MLTDEIVQFSIKYGKEHIEYGLFLYIYIYINTQEKTPSSGWRGDGKVKSTFPHRKEA